jgi:hypothetical protein
MSATICRTCHEPYPSPDHDCVPVIAELRAERDALKTSLSLLQGLVELTLHEDHVERCSVFDGASCDCYVGKVTEALLKAFPDECRKQGLY